MTWTDNERLVRAAWTYIAEPDDAVACLARDVLGSVDAMKYVVHDQPIPSEVLPADAPRATTRLNQALSRWQVRLKAINPERDLDRAARQGIRLIIPTDDEWPRQLDDLGPAAPPAIWVRGRGDIRALSKSVAIVGSRASTPYGQDVAAQMAAELSERGWTVLSGAAFGIDAAAHRGALVSSQRLTAAVLACGVDRVYPKTHEELIGCLLDVGVVISEVPPGTYVRKQRFLDRNRLIAALSRAVVVVEAAQRSGALSTAAHAARIGRPLGAVPGPIGSDQSRGCHNLIRDMNATLVANASHVLELACAIGEFDLSEADRDVLAHDSLFDQLNDVERRVYEALPSTMYQQASHIATVAGVEESSVRTALAHLELMGLAVQQIGGDGNVRFKYS